jgi:aminoglycoside phosphotransferase (APT) family kinase protein
MDASIATSLVRSILHTFDPALELLGAARPGHGLVSQVLFLETSQAELVLKLFDDDAAAWKPQKEAALFAAMRALGIPVPVVLAVDTSKGVAPFTWSLSERIDGDVFADVVDALVEDENSCIYRQLGDHLGTMHATTFPLFGDISGDAGDLVVGPAHDLDRDDLGRLQGPFGRWQDMHRVVVATRLNLMRDTEFGDLVPRVEAYFARNENLLGGDIPPRLLHMDLHPGNIMVRNGQIVGLLDVEEAIAGHNEYDLMRTALANFRGRPPAYERAFLDAYTQHVTLDEGYHERKHFYDVSRTLAWIRSLLLHGAAHSAEQSKQYRQAARTHLEALLDADHSRSRKG